MITVEAAAVEPSPDSPATDSPATGGTWMCVGQSREQDAFTAGSAATGTAMSQAGERHPKLLIVFCAPNYDLRQVLDGICSQAPDDVRIVGVSTDGEIPAASSEPGGALDCPSVLVTLLGGDTLTVATELVTDLAADPHASGVKAAHAIRGIDSPHRVLMLLLDGISATHELVWGAYSELGVSVPIVGGLAADGDTHVLTSQFYGTGAQAQVLTDAAIGIGIGSTAPIGVGVAHGWRRVGEAMVVTSSSDQDVYMLDDEPALDVYLRRLGMTRKEFAAIDHFMPRAVRLPLAMKRRFGDDIRVVHAGDLTTGAISCLADIPQGALVWTMESDTEALLGAATDSARMAVQGLDGAAPAALLVFDCGGRRVQLGESVAAEHAALSSASMGAAVSGFYSFGEVARTKGARGLHHLTVVCLALA